LQQISLPFNIAAPLCHECIASRKPQCADCTLPIGYPFWQLAFASNVRRKKFIRSKKNIFQPWEKLPDFVAKETFFIALPLLFAYVTGAKRKLTYDDCSYVWSMMKRDNANRITFNQFHKVESFVDLCIEYFVFLFQKPIRPLEDNGYSAFSWLCKVMVLISKQADIKACWEAG
jgi:hypothetical protein